LRDDISGAYAKAYRVRMTLAVSYCTLWYIVATLGSPLGTKICWHSN